MGLIILFSSFLHFRFVTLRLLNMEKSPLRFVLLKEEKMKNLLTLIFVFGLLALLVGPKLSYADQRWGHHGNHQYFRYHDRPHYGFRVSAFYPDEYYPVWVGGARYYYDDGLYYNNVGGNYVVVSPPMGAVVSSIPSDFQAVNINGVTYFTDNGVYYIHTPSGYQVVSQPQAAAVTVNTGNVISVNVPNNGGGYTRVILKRSGNGFIGPQGEFYPEFPRVSKLQMLYGR